VAIWTRRLYWAAPRGASVRALNRGLLTAPPPGVVATCQGICRPPLSKMIMTSPSSSILLSAVPAITSRTSSCYLHYPAPLAQYTTLRPPHLVPYIVLSLRGANFSDGGTVWLQAPGTGTAGRAGVDAVTIMRDESLACHPRTSTGRMLFRDAASVLGWRY
jgi:hypothetical protein